MNLQERLNILNYYSAKEQTGKTFTPAEYNAIAPIAEMQLFKQLYADFEKKQVFTDALLPFKVFMGQESYLNGSVTVPGKAPLTIDSNGYAIIPSDYAHYSAIEYKKVENKPNCELKISYRKIVPVTDQQFNAYQNASIKRADSRYPICNFQNGFIRFLPTNLQRCNFVYLKYPRKPVFAYTTISSTDTYVYDPVNSVESEFRENEMWDTIILMLEAIGVNLNRTDLLQYANIESQKEQLNKAK